MHESDAELLSHRITMADFQFKITPWKEDGEIEPESQCAVLLSFTVQPPFEVSLV